jgi:hypothetical protein
LFGTWTGVVIEPRSAEHPQYPISVRIEPDINRRPVGIVVYAAFPCAGVWNLELQRGTIWRFQETITEGRERCAQHVVVELEPVEGGFMQVHLYPAGLAHMPSRGTLSRQ